MFWKMFSGQRLFGAWWWQLKDSSSHFDIQKYSRCRNVYTTLLHTDNTMSSKLTHQCFRTIHIATIVSILSIYQCVTRTEQHPPLYTLLFGSQMVLPDLGPQLPSVEYTA